MGRVLDWSYVKGEKVRELTGFEGRYAVSNKGVVYNMRTRCAVSQIRGAYVTLSKDGIVRTYRIGDLVAREWVENWRGFEWVRHKDGNVRNNRSENLVWVARRENLRRGKGKGAFKSHAVLQMDEMGGVIRRFGSISDACMETGVNRSGISNCCRGLASEAGGYKWRYEGRIG